MNKEARSRLWKNLLGFGVAALIVAFLLWNLDWHQASQIIHRVDMGPVAWALAATAASYASVCLAFAVVNRVLDIRLGTSRLMGLGFVSVALNHVIAIGGFAQHALRAWILSREGEGIGRAIAASVLHSYFNGIALFAMFPAGLIILLTMKPLPPAQKWGLITAAFLFLVGLVLLTTLVFSARFRHWVVGHLSAWGRAVLRRDFEEVLRRFDVRIGEGMRAIRARPSVLVILALLLVLDWAAMITSMGLSALALGLQLPIDTLVVAFTVGVAIGWVSLLPGGFGAQEATFTGILTLLGVGFTEAALTGLLFRLIYYMVPFLASLPLYWILIRQVKRAKTLDELAPPVVDAQ